MTGNILGLHNIKKFKIIIIATQVSVTLFWDNGEVKSNEYNIQEQILLITLKKQILSINFSIHNVSNKGKFIEQISGISCRKEKIKVCKKE